MNDRLVCAVDATPSSARAVSAAVSIGQAVGMRIVLVHVAGSNGDADADNGGAALKLEQALSGVPLPADAVRRIEVGDPAELVVAAADDEDAQLIVTATRPIDARRKAAVGSVTARIVELAGAPVVIAPAHRDSGLADATPRAREFVISVDGSDESRAVAAYAETFARRARARIVLAHVVPPIPPSAAPPVGIVPPLTSDEHRRGWKVLDAARRALPDPTGVELELRHGLPSQELDRLARERGSGLIVVGTRRPGRMRRILAGALADDLAASTTALLMVVPVDVARHRVGTNGAAA